MAERLAREQVPVEQTWNLADIYATPDAWENDLESLGGLIESVTAFGGRLGEGTATLLACLQARDALLEHLVKVSAYAGLSVSGDATDPGGQAMAARVATVGSRIGAALSFIPTELVALPDGVIARFLDLEPALETYRVQLDDVLRRKPHVLTPETESALAALSESLGLPGTVWRRATAADLDCAKVPDDEGGERPVSIASFVFDQSRSPNRNLRRRAYDSLNAGLARYQNTLATTLASEIRQNVTVARLRRYASATEMILEPQRVPRDVYEMIVRVVHDDGAPHAQRLMRLRQRVLGIDRMHLYDVYAPLDSDFEPPTTFAESAALIQEGLRPLGEEYARLLEACFRDRWIDWADNLGKASGAFCSFVYGVHPYVLTTWNDSLRSALILAHELGHAGHGVFASKNQVISNARAGLFFIEAPSTINELLLGQHILDTTTDPRLRRWVILQFIGTFWHNMVTHMLEAHFERKLYDLAEADRPLTLKTIMDIQSEVFEGFFGDSMVVDDGARLYWAQQPHFYVGLYPYTYSAGLACGYAVTEAIRSEGEPAVQRWLATLAAGGTLPPIELARLAGVDMSHPETIQRAVAFFGRLVDELEASYA